MKSEKVEKALQGLVSPDDLTEEEDELYQDRFAASHWEPSATEDEFFPAMRRDPNAVGMNEAGEIVYGRAAKTDHELLEEVTRDMSATVRTEAPNTDDAQHWIETHDTQTGRVTWRRRDLYEEWSRLAFKIWGTP